jgi:hypothetical protein
MSLIAFSTLRVCADITDIGCQQPVRFFLIIPASRSGGGAREGLDDWQKVVTCEDLFHFMPRAFGVLSVGRRSIIRMASHHGLFPASLALSLTAAVTLATGAEAPAHADHLNFTLYNSSGKTIRRLYVSPASSNSWGRDVLGLDVLYDGASTRINFPGQNSSSPCWWDVKVVFRSGSSSVGEYNLCRTRSITVE